jgi:CheY-like chemotaxis protein
MAVVNDLIAAQDESRSGLEAEIDRDDEETGSRPTVLVIDDHAAIRTLVRRRLEPMYRVVEAADGVKGLDKVRRLLPDLVISDVMMPELDGYGLCTALKADPETSFIPIILLTARAAQEDRITGWDTGADAYLAKPFDDRELMSVVVNQLAAVHRLRERLAERLEPTSSPDDSPAQDPFLRRVHEIIAQRCADEDFGVDDLVSESGLSRGTFYRRLEELAAEPPASMIRRVRLETAAAMLAAGTGNVGEVCYASGFRNLAHFCKAFKDTYGVTPSAYAAGGR